MRNAQRMVISVTGLIILFGGLFLLIPFYSEVGAIIKKHPEEVRIVNGPEMPVSMNVGK